MVYPNWISSAIMPRTSGLMQARLDGRSVDIGAIRAIADASSSSCQRMRHRRSALGNQISAGLFGSSKAWASIGHGSRIWDEWRCGADLMILNCGRSEWWPITVATSRRAHDVWRQFSARQLAGPDPPS